MIAMARHWEAVRTALREEKARASNVIKTEATAFLPAALEIIEEPVSPTARVTTWVLLLGLTLTIFWLAFGKIDVVASAPGKLIPAENVKLVQPAEAGVVRAILVRHGQRVRRGQPLIELDPTVSNADAVQAGKALETAELDAARARAILSALAGKGLAFVAPVGTSPLLIQAQRDLAAAQLSDIRATAAMHAATRQASVYALGEASIETAKLTETLPLLDEQIEANEKLLAKGFVSKLKVIEMRRQRLSAEKDRAGSIETANKARAQMAEAGSSIAQSIAEAKPRLLTDLTEADSDAHLRREELVKATQRSGFQRLLAPVDGTITQLSIHTIGGVVEATKPLMIVVPSGGPVIGEVKVLNKDVGSVHRGNEVALKLDAYPFTRFGTVSGRIQSIGSDAVEDDKLGLVYITQVELEPPRTKSNGTNISLTPGLTATADIKTGRRSIITFLLDPLSSVIQTAAREK